MAKLKKIWIRINKQKIKKKKKNYQMSNNKIFKILLWRYKMTYLILNNNWTMLKLIQISKI